MADRGAGSDRGRSSEPPREFALIIGAMKSGTTSLFELLSQHPEVSACRVKEADFFSSDRGHRADWEEYLALWDWKQGQHKVALEASPSYAKAPWISGVPARIGRIPDARFRFIYIMREPISRIESQIRHSLFAGWGRPLDEGMTEDLIDFTRYAMQIDEYVSVFPRESLLLLTLDDLRVRPDAVLRTTCEFLGLSTAHVFKDTSEVRNSGDYFSVAPAVAAAAENTWLKSLVRRLPRPLRGKLRAVVARLAGGRKSLGRWRLNERERQEVLERLRPDLLRLQQVYGIDVEDLWSVPASLLVR